MIISWPEMPVYAQNIYISEAQLSRSYFLLLLPIALCSCTHNVGKCSMYISIKGCSLNYIELCSVKIYCTKPNMWVDLWFFFNLGTEPTVWEDHGPWHRRAAPPASWSRRGGAGDWEGFQQVTRGGRTLNPSWPHNRSKLINLDTTKHHLVPCLSLFSLPWWRQQPFMECLMSLLELLISALSVVGAAFYTTQTPAVTYLNNIERLRPCFISQLRHI